MQAMEYTFVELDMRIIERARNLLDRYVLRAYDSIQLASALIANQILVERELPPLIFISADARLLQVATAEGLAVDNPNLHP